MSLLQREQLTGPAVAPPKARNAGSSPPIAAALLTGGSDRPYVFGLTTSLMCRCAALDLIGSDELDFPEFHSMAGLNFLKLRGSQSQDAGFVRKLLRVSLYYARLIRYAATGKPKLFHILWNNRFETFDRTLLMCYYKLLRKKVALTAHNINAAKRDGSDTRLNRLTLRIQYRLADHIFVHTEPMKGQLSEDFGVHEDRVTVIPFGINNAVPVTHLTPADARRRLGIREGERTILFFGRITPYKGLEYLIAAFRQIAAGRNDYRLIVAGRPDRCEEYWKGIQREIREEVASGRVLLNAQFIPDNETEVYFKAADVLVLPYRSIYQSGVLFLAHSFGLPVIATDVGSLKDDVVDGKTGYIVKPEDSVELGGAIERYFRSELYAHLDTHRREIKEYAAARHSWDTVGEMTMDVYARLLQSPGAGPRS